MTGAGRIAAPLICSAANRVPKVAATLVFPFSVTVQVLAIPVHGLPQPKKPQAVSGVAVRVTCVPELKLLLQVEPQLIPEGELVTVPPGLPNTETERV
jgi:hypothetical protein